MTRPERLRSIDLLRGAVMVVMALDHVRDFFTNVPFDPTDLEKTWPALFFTRWITHFCAPVFVFLAGTGSYLSIASGKPKPEVARFLLTRGVWLVVLENTVVRFGWNLDVTSSWMLLQVIWAIGIAMIVLAALVFLPLRAILAVGFALVVGHDLLDPFDGRLVAAAGGVWRVLHAGGPLDFGPLHGWVGYPVLPWIGVMLLGYAFGGLLGGDARVRRRRIALLGAGATLAFIALRAANVYGDPAPWSLQRTPLFTLMSFLDCSKYPPSLLYLLMTLGPALLVLAAIDGARGEGLSKPILVLGRVPMFFYLLHLVVIHALAMVAGEARYGRFDADLVHGPFGPKPPGWGWGLPVVYTYWVGIVVLLYPVCAWFAGVKRRRTEAWLRFL